MNGHTHQPLEPVWPWVWRNLARLAAYLSIASLVSASVMVLGESAIGGDLFDSLGAIGALWLYLCFLGGVGCLPGLAVWLVILARLPGEWSRTRRRAVAVATAPLVGLFWLVVFLTNDAAAFGLIFGLFWPLGAGLVVRLRETQVAVAEASG